MDLVTQKRKYPKTPTGVIAYMIKLARTQQLSENIKQIEMTYVILLDLGNKSWQSALKSVRKKND